jgi:biotin carboxyl carrier protein
MSKHVKVSGKDFLVDFEGDNLEEGTVNEKRFSWDVSKLSENQYHVIKDNRSFNVEMLPTTDGIRQIKVNGTIYETEAIDKFDALLKQLGMEKGGAGKVNELKAPMPGLVLEIDVNVGDQLTRRPRAGFRSHEDGERN